MTTKIRDIPLWQLLIIVAAILGLLLGSISIIQNGLNTPSRTSTEVAADVLTKTLVPEKASPVPSATSTPTRQPTPTLPPTATRTPRPTWTPSPTPIAVITGIHAFGRLETAQYTLRDIVEMADAPNNIIEQFSQDKLLLIAEGEVVAGFDLTKITEGDIYAISDTVLLMLPEPEILYSRIDNERTYVYERETGLFRRPDPDLETAARRLAERQIRDWALERGILDDAEEFGVFYLKNFLHSLGFRNVRIEIRR